MQKILFSLSLVVVGLLNSCTISCIAESQPNKQLENCTEKSVVYCDESTHITDCNNSNQKTEIQHVGDCVIVKCTCQNAEVGTVIIQ